MAPGVPTAKVRRLDTLNKSALARPKPVPRAKKKAACCDSPQIEDFEGQKVCANCGTQISESNIVADVTFGEDSRGAATVQGGYIGDNARHARTLGAGAYRRIGGGERNAQQEIENNGRRALSALCPRLSIPENVQQQAQRLFGIAAGLGFNAGRRTDEVAAACLFAACRRRPDNTLMLMDLAEVLKVNVFRLGDIYKTLCKTCYLNQESVGIQHLVDVEPLIFKYCSELEFGDKTNQVATDAVRIVTRMKRDWIVTGRHPAGLCAACIILAARMNNFRRTVRELVLVARIGDMTISKRMEEFRRTKASDLTIDQFRQYGTRLKYQHDPPVLTYSELRKEKFEAKKRKRQDYNVRRETAERESAQRDSVEQQVIVISDGEEESSPEAESEGESSEQPQPKRQRKAGLKGKQSSTQQLPRFDADGFAIPALPASASAPDGDQEEAEPPKRRVGRPRKDERPAPVLITEEDLVEERELENNIDEILNDQELQDARTDLEKAKDEERARLLADQQRELAAKETEERRKAEGLDWWNNKAQNHDESTNVVDLEAEFADDPEVINCQLSEEESRIKEQIWVAHNEDWLRSQQEKEIIKKMAEAAGADKDRANKRGGKVTKKGKKRSKMGDRSVLEEADTPIETPADANAAMLKKRAPAGFSKFLDYERLAAVYGTNRSTPESASRSASEAPGARESVARSTPARSSASPTPEICTAPAGLLSPQATQRKGSGEQATAGAAPPEAPGTPPDTQLQPSQAGYAASEADDYDEVEDDYTYRSPTPGGSEFGGGGGSEYGGGYDDDDDFERGLDDVNTQATFGGEDYE